MKPPQQQSRGAAAELPRLRFNPVLIPQGDGSFLVKPGRPVWGREKLTISETVKRYGYSRSTWERLFDCRFVEGERASPRKILLYVDSIENHIAASGDSEFWNRNRQRQFESNGGNAAPVTRRSSSKA